MSAEDKSAKGVAINLLGREFRVACPEGEEKQLMASVEYLNRKLKEVRDVGKVTGNERIAMMAALNIAHEMMSNTSKANGTAAPASFDASAYKRRILAMQETLDSALAADQENLF
jgi:cell division protein ZapA